MAEPTVLTPTEVARLFGVDPKTVTKWAKQGLLPTALRTLGGHRRFHRSDVERLLQQQDTSVVSGRQRTQAMGGDGRRAGLPAGDDAASAPTPSPTRREPP